MAGFDEDVGSLHFRLIELQKEKAISAIRSLSIMVPHYSEYDTQRTAEEKTLPKKIRELSDWIEDNV